jgi:serine/threonine protein kinase
MVAGMTRDAAPRDVDDEHAVLDGDLMERLGRYDLLRRLGAGGMAEVHLARAIGPEGFQKLVVLKRILPHLSADPEFVRMFLAEARLAAILDHPNVVQVFDIGRDGSDWFFTMEYVYGETLRSSRPSRSASESPPGCTTRTSASASTGVRCRSCTATCRRRT